MQRQMYLNVVFGNEPAPQAPRPDDFRGASAARRRHHSLQERDESIAPVPMPADSVQEIHMKGNKGATSDGDQTTILDFQKQEITVVDKTRRKFATIPASEYGGKMAAAMPPMDMSGLAPGSMKTISRSQSPQRARRDHSRSPDGRTRYDAFDGFADDAHAPPGRVAGAGDDDENGDPGVERDGGQTLRVPAIHQLMGFNLWQEILLGWR